MDFSKALTALKQGSKLTRTGWNGSGQFIVSQKGYPTGIAINKNTSEATGLPVRTTCIFRPYIMLRTADGSFVPWVATQSDILENDWEIPQ